MIGKFIKKVAFSIVLAAFSFLAIEVLMIVCEPWLFRGFYQYDRELGFRIRPGVAGSNRFGFNDRDYPLERQPGIYRILFVGDSFSWKGLQEWNYTVVLEQMFEEHFGGHRVDVINAGYTMTATGEQLAMLRKCGLQYNPDLVVLGFFVGNDVLDASRFRKRIVVGDTYFDIDARNERLFLGRPMVGQSRLLAFVKQRWKAHTSTEKSHGPDHTDLFERDVYLEIERQRMQVCETNRVGRGEFSEQYTVACEDIAAMRDLLQPRRIGFTVALFPDEFQVEDELARDVFEKFALKPEDYDLALLQKKIGACASGLTIPCLDLLDAFRAHGVTNDLYLPRNTHWNEAGNRLAAQVLFDYLLPSVESALGVSQE